MEKLKLNQFTALLSSDLLVAVKVFKANENGEVSRDDNAVEYGLLWTQPYINTFTYKTISGKSNDFRKIANATILEFTPLEFLCDFQLNDKNDIKDYEKADFMICIKID